MVVCDQIVHNTPTIGLMIGRVACWSASTKKKKMSAADGPPINFVLIHRVRLTLPLLIKTSRLLFFWMKLNLCLLSIDAKKKSKKLRMEKKKDGPWSNRHIMKQYRCTFTYRSYTKTSRLFYLFYCANEYWFRRIVTNKKKPRKMLWLVPWWSTSIIITIQWRVYRTMMMTILCL